MPRDWKRMPRVRWTIRRRLLLGSGFTVAAFALIGLGTVLLARAHREMKERMAAVVEVQGHLFAAHDAVQRYVVLAQGDLLGGGELQGARMDSVSAVADSVRRLLMGRTGLEQAQRTGLERIGALQGRIGARLAIARAFQDVGEPERAVLQARLAAASLDTLFAESSAIAASESRQAAATLEQVDAVVRRQQWMLRSLLALGFLVALAFAWFTWRAVARPLRLLAETAQRVGEGDLTARADPRGLDAEYRVLADALARTTGRLSTLVRVIQGEAREVAGAASALTDASGQAALSTGQISATMSEIATGTEGQLVNLAASRLVLERVGGSAEALDRTAERSRTLAGEIQAAALGARDEIARALHTLGRAKEVIGVSASEVARLEETSRAVEGFVQTIQEISSQTNLLALNAAIEAARAGDHGRGFAVVAEEVRKLSTHSTQAAGEVRGVVEAMRRQVGGAVAAFREGVGGLGNVDAVSRTATEALEGIHGAVAGIDDLAAAVGEAAASNRDAVREMTSHMSLTSEHAESQAAASQQAAAGAQETAATTEEVAATASQLAENAARLSEMVSTFRV